MAFTHEPDKVPDSPSNPHVYLAVIMAIMAYLAPFMAK